MNDVVYSLDFGTSNTLLGAGTKLGAVDSIKLDFESKNNNVLKSVMYTPSEHEWHFGEVSYKKYLEKNGEGRFFRSFKSLLSRPTFNITNIHGKNTTVEELTARFIREIRHRANNFYQKDVEKLIIGRPCLFSENLDEDKLAQSRLENAIKIAGFKNFEFIYEPVAAAKSMKGRLQGEKLVLIVDLGGGTSDFSIVKLSNGNMCKNDVLGVSGIKVAGDSYDFQLMSEFIIPHFGSKYKFRRAGNNHSSSVSRSLFMKMCSPAIFSLINDSQISDYLDEIYNFAIDKDSPQPIYNLELLFENKLGFDLMKVLEEKKIELSNNIFTKFIYDKKGIDVKHKITQDDFLNASQDVTNKIKSSMIDCLKKSEVSKDQIDLVITTGGTASHPQVNELLNQIFGSKKIMNADTSCSVIRGLSIFAHESI